MKTIVFLGAKNIGFRCLNYLLQHSSNLQAQVIALATKPLTSGKLTDIEQLAIEHNVRILETIDQIPPCDILLSVQYHRILKPLHINLARQIAVNLHMAPLPEYRGCNQFSFAILDQATEFGTTLHRLEPGIDSGAILFETRFDIPPQCWVEQLYELTETASEMLFTTNIAHIIQGNYRPVLQESLVPLRGTAYHYRHEIDQIKQIDLNWDAETIERHIRATWFPPFEPPYAIVAGQKVYFCRKTIPYYI